jgi:hypothetical protein
VVWFSFAKRRPAGSLTLAVLIVRRARQTPGPQGLEYSG